MLRRFFILAAMAALAVPSVSMAQANPLQSSFEKLADRDRRAAQEQLQTGGFYTGAIDGRYGRGTQSGLINAAEFIYENSYRKVRFDLSSPAGTQGYLTALARGDLGKYLFGEGDEADY
ncbi:peptidoglycan-binding protein [Paracoccus sp. 1_MG-2023]|uniref:peptidoglycan-binding domain-containing protein n=1 Tax=unclassified Paracoccus (in: a-proteobacteria) TaxID=2688777 RepID=UPI001C0830E6|nr:MULTISPECIES: peptidoglycan-binding protein [unclassified Paracoccus (in: a-proteobacteria)]MBU2959197.1 peptidoglycan-binding protein [Paracoccus sp. C2R09]MDO6670066.1 peptidoglycan-binding protein [Paracoccus sp. 1_MG-2023]